MFACVNVVLLHTSLPGLLNLRRINPVLHVHQLCFELTYGPPKSTKFPIIPVKHIAGMKVLDRTYPAVIMEADMVPLKDQKIIRSFEKFSFSFSSLGDPLQHCQVEGLPSMAEDWKSEGKKKRKRHQ